MATSHTNELRELHDEELQTRLRESKEELFNLRFQAATGQLESHGRLHAVRREIARIYTVMRERELGIITFVDEVALADDDAADVGYQALARRTDPRESKVIGR